ncbi:MFS transporter [Alterinioella nitratireducens]|uniref:MFS transporter n=1 Tax=Alterinioella nitratireducens TaxID=2735915 RepID=UPI004059A841
MSILSALRLSHRPARGFAVIGVLWGSFAAQVPVFKAGLGVDDTHFGLIFLGTSLGLVTTIWLAPLFDRILGRSAMPVASMLVASAFLMPGLVTHPALFMGVMMALGLTSGLLDVVINARVSELEAANNRSLMNANHGMFSLAYAISAMLTGLAREVGLPPVAVFACLWLVIAVLASGMRLTPAPVDEAERAAQGAFPWRVVLICGGIVLIAFFVEATVEAWSALHIERTLGGRAAEGAFGPAVLGLTMAFGRFSGQAISGRFSETSVIVISSGLASIGALIAAAAPGPAIAYLGFGTMGLGISVVGPMGLALVGRLVRPGRRTAAVARAAVIGFVGFMAAPAVMGLMSGAFGLRMAFVAVAMLALIGPGLALAIRVQAQFPSKSAGISRL